MFEKTNEPKVLRDPVHGYIHVEYAVIWKLIGSHWFQRLRRIRQLGGACMVYHCAEHTRFSHSLGVYEIVRRMVSEVQDISDALTEREKVTVMAAGLLHDLGHGPYSHAFEEISRTNHELYTVRIIEKDPEIRSILESAGKGLSRDVADVIRHKSENPLLSQLISSQLDADRMDYLLRDAYFTGTKYGEFDMERILRTLRVVDGKLVVKQSGVYAVENYIMARYHMYWQVYYHPVARSHEAVLHTFFHRLKDIGNEEDPMIIDVLKPLIGKKKLTLEQYYALDEHSITYGFEVLTRHTDPVLRDLAHRILDRDLFEYTDMSARNLRSVKQALLEQGLDPEYYLMKDEVKQSPYVPYGGQTGSIFVKMKDGSIRELSNASNIVFSLIHGPSKDEKKIFYPAVISK